MWPANAARSEALGAADRNRLGGGEQPSGFTVAVALGAGPSHGICSLVCVSVDGIASLIFPF